MKALVYEKIENTSRQELNLKDVLKLSLPFALDGVPADSEIWTKFRDIIFSN